MSAMPTEARSAEPAISEIEWNRILQRIEDGKVIPVIGEHLTVMSSGDPPREMPLAGYLAEQLGLPGPPTTSLDELARRYKETNPRTDDLYTDIYQVLLREEETTPLPTPLRQLAEIRDFNLFVSTSFDPFMRLALNEVRFGRRSSDSTHVHAYQGDSSVDLPKDFAKLDYPLVYHLFGKAEATPIFAVTDEDVLEFVHKLQAPECQPPNLADALREKRLLVLGTRLTGWLTCFFLRIGSGQQRLRDAKRTDFVVDPSSDGGADQTAFLKRFSEAQLLPTSPARFVEELARRWKARHPTAAASEGAQQRAPAPAAAGEVFLSYASEDLAVVKQLRERLEREAGVRVWLDKNALRVGDQWERCIADTLRGCALVIPVISAGATSPHFRYVRTEWKEAMRLQEGRPADQKFIFPLVIDDTRPDHPALDPGIRALHCYRLRDEDEMRRFIAEVRAAVEKTLSP